MMFAFCFFSNENLPFFKDIDSHPDFIPKLRNTSTPLVSEVVINQIEFLEKPEMNQFLFIYCRFFR